MAKRYGITIDSKARTATVLAIRNMSRISTLMLNGNPNFGAITPDRQTLFVALGGTSYPPSGNGVAIISGDPLGSCKRLKLAEALDEWLVHLTGVRRSLPITFHAALRLSRNKLFAP